MTPSADDGTKDDGTKDDGTKDDGTKDDEDDDCGWGWWPIPLPLPDTDSSAPDGGGGYGGGAPSTSRPPLGRPGAPPGMNVPPPPEVLPESPVVPVLPDPQDPLPGLVAPAAAPVVSLPVIVLSPALPGIGGGGAVGPRAPAPENAGRPAPTRATPAERPAAPRSSEGVVPASYRAGYGEYLRTAGMPQVIAVAVPGATGIMLLTGAGGLIGYRQARAGRAIRAGGSARFSS